MIGLTGWSFFETQLVRILTSFFTFRGDHIVPNFEEIWPSGKPRRQRGGPSIPSKGIGYVEHAMKVGIPGEKDKDFTTVGRPKVCEA